MSSRWRQTSPAELAGWLAEATIPWGIAGGWALDLWQGSVSRPHSDIEISCFLFALPALLPRLDSFEIVVARNKQLTPHAPGAALPPRHSASGSVAMARPCGISRSSPRRNGKDSGPTAESRRSVTR